MEKIRIELERDEWYDIEWALRLAEMEEMGFAEKAEAFLDTAQHERAEKVIERHKECAGRYRNLLEEIEKQTEKPARTKAEIRAGNAVKSGLTEIL